MATNLWSQKVLCFSLLKRRKILYKYMLSVLVDTNKIKTKEQPDIYRISQLEHTFGVITFCFKNS